MAAITDPRVIKFVNEQIRPLSEETRAFKARVSSMTTDWFASINTLTPNDSSPLADGRDAEGISRLTGADINSAVGNLISAHDAINDQIIAKPCVRAISVS